MVTLPLEYQMSTVFFNIDVGNTVVITPKLYMIIYSDSGNTMFTIDVAVGRQCAKERKIELFEKLQSAFPKFANYLVVIGIQ